MKINFKDTGFIVGIAVLLITVGLLTGYWAVRFETDELIATIEADNQFAYDRMEEYETELLETYEELNAYKNDFVFARDSLIAEQDKNVLLLEELNKAKDTVNTLKSEEYELVYIGDFKITYYCDSSYEHICGYGKHITASGKKTEVGWTAASDWGVLPNGTIVYISGIGFREIMDAGGAVNGNHIDVLVQEHQEALNLGTSYKDVWVLIKKNS